MKKFLTCILLFVLMVFICSGLSIPAYALESSSSISVLIDGLPVAFDTNPVIKNGRTMVPFRALSETLNVKVDWDDSTKTVTAYNGATTIRLQIGSSIAYLNSAAVTMDSPPLLLNGRTLIPLRFFSEAFNCNVAWIDNIKTVKITSPKKVMEVTGFYALGDSQTSSWTDLFESPYPDTGPGNTEAISNLALGWYSLDRDGNLLTQSRTGWQRPESWEKVLEAADYYKIKTEMVIHLTDKDSVIANIITDQLAVDRAIEGIVKEAELYQGVNLDFEGLGWQENGVTLDQHRNAFVKFIGLLNNKLKAENKSLILTLHPLNSAYKGYDYGELGKNSDRIVIMAYDYGIKPEPVSHVLQAVDLARAVVPAEKLVLGISIPGETVDSLNTKIGIAKRYNLQGIALWRLGLLPDEIWHSIKSSVTAEK